ncbi:hypothetical protein AALJ34_17205 [Paraclostridium bifermentans]|uniref:hypothetical protein n=1 Tax=Paraclostridium bifermentans TaxID=1490 RepID=UPI001C101CBA|nr:hypothetical protein [Paraclostridium bifermentans]MBU5290099.1 hypothetical protein [Paraclostridium bifermentans]
MENKVDLTQTRNETIVLIYEHAKLKFMEIAKMQVQHIDKSFALIRVQRGDRVFRVSLTPKISNNLKLIIKDKEFNDYIFNSRGNNKKHLSHTMIKKIIDNFEIKESPDKKQVENIYISDIVGSIEHLESLVLLSGDRIYNSMEYKNLIGLKDKIKGGNINWLGA